jgi:hypothetical protein
MIDQEFLSLLNAIDFPRRYWELCDRFPIDPSVAGHTGRKEDILAAFAEMGVTPKYTSKFRTFECEEEQIGDFLWRGVFTQQRHGLELSFGGESNGVPVGSNFAVMAYNAKQMADPSYKRDPFSGPPPYPRPNHNGVPEALKAIVKEFVILVRAIKDAIRLRREAN